MTENYRFTYLSCQTCRERVNCGQCASLLEQALMRMEGVRGATIQMATRQVFVDADMGESDLLDCFEDIGIFVD